MQALADDPARLQRWRDHAHQRADDYQQDALGRRHVAFMEQVLSLSPGGLVHA